MDGLLRALMGMAGVGFVLSVLVHGSALLAWDPGWGQAVWLLHAGAILVAAPLIFLLNAALRGASTRDYWGLLFRGCPDWMRWALGGLVAYAGLNLALFVLSRRGMGAGSRFLPLRVFSGAWMLFYAGAYAAAYSRLTTGPLAPRRCPGGHDVPVPTRFGPERGRLLAAG